jgi:hypothetical protein
MRAVLLFLILCAPALAASPPNWTTILNITGTPASNWPQTQFKDLVQGDFPAGTYPRPSVGGVAMPAWQVNPVKWWPDGTPQTCTFNSVGPGGSGQSGPSVSLNCVGTRAVEEGDVFTVTGNGSIPNGIYPLVGITSTTPVMGYFPNVPGWSGTAVNGSATVADYGSIKQAYVSFPFNAAALTYDSSHNVLTGFEQVDFVRDPQPCALGDQAVCDASALTQAQILAFNSAQWGLRVQTSANGGNCQAINFNFRTAVANGDFTYLLKGPLVTRIDIENLSTAGPAYDGGCNDLATTAITQVVSQTAMSFTVADCTELNALGSSNISAEPIHGSAGPEIMTVASCNTSTNLATMSARGVAGSALILNGNPFNGTTRTASAAGAGATMTVVGFTVSAADVNGTFNITNSSGGWVTGIHTIQSVGSGTWTFADNVTTGAATGLTGSLSQLQQSFNIASNIRVLGAPAGSVSSWTERPLGTLGVGSLCGNILSTDTTAFGGAADLFGQLIPYAPYTLQIDSEYLTDAGTITGVSNGGNSHTFTARGTIWNGNASAAAIHGGCPWMYAQPWYSNWVTSSNRAQKGLHPIGIATFYTPDGVHQWPGVDEQVIMRNTWMHSAQDQFYALTITTGASLNVTKVNGDRVPHPWQTEWRRRFWDGTAPGGVDCPYGTQTECGVAIDYNVPYLAATGLIPPLAITTGNVQAYPIDPTSSVANMMTGSTVGYCTNGAYSYGGFCPTDSPQQSWLYTEPGAFHHHAQDTGSRQETPWPSEMEQNYLFMMGLTAATQTNVTWNLEGHEVGEMAWDGVMHWPFDVNDDVSTLFFDDLHTVSSFNRVISLDAHPTTQGDINPNWFATCIGHGSDCPTLVGFVGNIQTNTSGGRTSDYLQPDTAHYDISPALGYILTGDEYYLEGVYQNGSLSMRANAAGDRPNSPASSGIILSDQTRSFANLLRGLYQACGLARSGSPEERYFCQKAAYNAQGAEGWMLIPLGYFADTKTSSNYYWGLNTEHLTPLTNPLGLYTPLLSEDNEPGEPCQAPCSGTIAGNYTLFTGSFFTAPWQDAMIQNSLNLGYSFGINAVKYVRQTHAKWIMGFVNSAIAYAAGNTTGLPLPNPGNVASYYIPTRLGANSGTIPYFPAAGCTKSILVITSPWPGGTTCVSPNPLDTTQSAIGSWSDFWKNQCTESTLAGCGGDVTPSNVNRWNAGIGSESYQAMQFGALAWMPDVDADNTICLVRAAGDSRTCALVTWLKLNAIMPLIADSNHGFPSMEQWNWAPLNAFASQIPVGLTFLGGARCSGCILSGH